MSPERDDEMPAEFDMRGSVKGKYLERYHRWASQNRASITDATGTIEVPTVTSAGEVSAKIVMPQPEFVFLTTQPPQERRDVIASAANAV